MDFDGNTSTDTYYPPTLANGQHDPQAGLLHQVTYTPYAAAPSTDVPATFVYTYSALGQLSTVSDLTGTTTDSYDAQGNLDEQQAPEGTIWYVFSPVTGEHVETWNWESNWVPGRANRRRAARAE